MSILIFTTLLFFVGFLAGILGALTGLGGGIVIIPVLALLFKINIHYAMGVSIICVIATSSGAAMANIKNFANLKIGIFLETAAVLGALLGALLVSVFPTGVLAVIFGSVLILSSYLTITRKEESEVNVISHPWAISLNLGSHYPTPNGSQPYQVQRVPLSWCLMLVAGGLSGLLGIGSGVLKVLAMDQAMRLPYKVSTTTSNFMIGITAAVGAGVYFSKGYVNPSLTFPVVLGVLLGAFMGAKLLVKVETKILRILFSIVILILALQMIYKGLTGQI